MLYMDPMGTYFGTLFGDELISQKHSVIFLFPNQSSYSTIFFCLEFHHFEQEFQSSQQVSMTEI